MIKLADRGSRYEYTLTEIIFRFLIDSGAVLGAESEYDDHLCRKWPGEEEKGPRPTKMTLELKNYMVGYLIDSDAVLHADSEYVDRFGCRSPVREICPLLMGPTRGPLGSSEHDIGYLIDSDVVFHADSESFVHFDCRSSLSELCPLEWRSLARGKEALRKPMLGF